MAEIDVRLRLPEVFQQAMGFHQAGNLIEAERLYRQICAVDPCHVDSLHFLGVLAGQAGRNDVAIDLIGRALALKPDNADAHYNLGNILAMENRLDQAVAHYGQTLARKPDSAEAHHSLGVVLLAQGNFTKAMACFERALSLQPDFAEAHYNLGSLLAKMNKLDQAAVHFKRAVALKPDFPEAHNSLGTVLSDQGKPGEAMACFERALVLQPDFAEAHYNQGVALAKENRLDDAAKRYERALRLKPDYYAAHYNLGNILKKQGRLDDALASYDRALAIRPGYVDALCNRGTVLLERGNVEAAIICYKRALALKAEQPLAHTGLIFALNFDLKATTADHQAERARWDERHARQFARVMRPHANEPDPDRPLRVGYVSSHFRHQAATYAFGGVLLGHDPRSFDVACYSDTLREDEDDVTARLRAHAGKWRQTVGLSDEAVANLIRADGIDILVDLVGHMHGQRLLVFARRPAPVQVTAWGEPTGTGLGAMDYLLADPVLVPVNERALLAERVVDLPNFLGYWTPEPLPEPGELPALRHDHVTFGSFCRLAKIGDSVLRTWGAILRALPKARLVLKDRAFADSSQCARIRGILEEEGIAAERTKLLDPSDRDRHFTAYREIDIALDPFPHGGGMTTLDALWMGVPVVTWAGRTISSRLAAASLTALGLTDFVAPDLGAYVELAIAKATHLDTLSRLRASLRQRVADLAFGDPARYTRAVEAAYREMWRSWCARKHGAPAPL